MQLCAQLSHEINENTDASEWHFMADSQQWNDDSFMLSFFTCFLRIFFKPINANHISTPVAKLVAVVVKIVGNRFTHSSLVENDNKCWTVVVFLLCLLHTSLVYFLLTSTPLLHILLATLWFIVKHFYVSAFFCQKGVKKWCVDSLDAK